MIKILKSIWCKLMHEGHYEVTFYDTQEQCYTATCRVCGRDVYVGAGAIVPTKFELCIKTEPGSLNLVRSSQLKMLSSVSEVTTNE